LQAEIEVMSVRDSRTKPTQGMLVVQVDTKNQHGEVVQKLRPKIVVPKRPTGATP
jgi:acyl dehydratase